MELGIWAGDPSGLKSAGLAMRSGAHGGPKRTDFKRRHLIFEAAS